MPTVKSIDIKFNGSVHDANDLGLVLGAQPGLLSQQNVVARSLSNGTAGLLVRTFDEARLIKLTREYAQHKNLGGLIMTTPF